MGFGKQVAFIWVLLLTATLALPALAIDSPLEWYDSTKLDDEDGNKVEDLLDGIAANPVKALVPLDVFVCFVDDCRPASRLAELNLLSQRGLGYASTVVASVVVKGILVQDLIDMVATWPEVGYIHLDHECEHFMSTAGEALKAHAGLYSPDTAEDLGYDGTGITIAILDTGVDDPGGSGTVHSHLPTAVGGLFFDNDANMVMGNPDDEFYHGTSVAGCALGRGDSNGANRGVAPGASLFDARITKPGIWGKASESTIQAAVDWIHDNSHSVTPAIKVANISFGSNTESAGTALTASIDALANSGVVVVVGAGNHDSCTDDGAGNTAGIGMIAVAPRAITAAAASHENDPNRVNDVIANYSRLGPGIGSTDKPDITAYGSQCTRKCPTGCDGGNTISIQTPRANSTDQYRDFGGTSAASPMVAGAAALLLEKNPSMSPAAVKKQLMDTAEDYGAAGWDTTWGAGLMDVGAALAFPSACDLAVINVDYSPKPVECFQEVTITVTVKNLGNDPISDFSVDFQRWYFGPNNDPPQRFQLVASPVDNTSGELARNATRDFTAKWTPGVSDNLPLSKHSCFWGIVNSACDTNESNNERNINVTIVGVSDQDCQEEEGDGGDDKSLATKALVDEGLVEFPFRIAATQSEPQLVRVLLENNDPANWFAELDINGIVDPVEVPVMVDNKDCPTWGTLRVNRQGIPMIGNFQVVALDPVGAVLGEMQVMVNFTDADGDGVVDVDDNCPDIPNEFQEDADGDFIGDVCDNCPEEANPDQEDSDGGTVFREDFEGGTLQNWEFTYSTNGDQSGQIDPPGSWSSQIVGEALAGVYSARLYADSIVHGGGGGPWRTDAAISRQVGRTTHLSAKLKFDAIQGTGGTGASFFQISLFSVANNSKSISYGFSTTGDIGGNINIAVSPGDELDFAADVAGDYFARHGEAVPDDLILRFRSSADYAEGGGGVRTTNVLVDDIVVSSSRSDGLGDACDNCPTVYNPSQTDSDGDDVGNACDGDCPSLDGVDPVNFGDFGVFANDWRRPTLTPLAGDVNGDGVVDFKDLRIIAIYWLSNCSE